MHDLIIVGAGPAALTAAIYGARRKLKTLVLEGKPIAGGRPATYYPYKKIENYPGFPEGVRGANLAESMVQQAKKAGAEIKTNQEVVEMELDKDPKIVKTKRATFKAKTVIIAVGTGGVPRKLGVPGEEELAGKAVFYTLSEPEKFSNQKVLVVGGGNVAVENALKLNETADKVFIAHRRDVLRAAGVLQDRLKKSDVEILWCNELRKIIRENDAIREVRLINNKTGKESSMEIDSVLINIGFKPATEMLDKAGLTLEKNVVKVNAEQKTNIPGVYAAGDITGGLRQIASAVGEGAVAAISAYKHAKKPYWA